MGGDMNILCVEDEKPALELLLSSVRRVVGEKAVVCGYRNAKEALDAFSVDGRVDVAFIDIELREMSGIELAEEMKRIYPKINIVFTTGYSEHMHRAFEMHASGYILKPVTETKVRNELSNLRFAVEEDEDTKRLYVQTFGYFEVFYAGKPVEFRYHKTKEMFAYLIDRAGEFCGIHEISLALWEDDGDHSSYLKNLRRDLYRVLEETGQEKILVKRRGELAVLMDEIDCDLVDYLQKRISPEKYNGLYMERYSWAESTKARLENLRWE